VAISAPEYVPSPEIPDERNLSEKEQVRRAEQRLLPSQPEPPPPDASGPSLPGDSTNNAPHDAEPLTLPAPSPGDGGGEFGAPSAPTLEDLGGGAGGGGGTEDKQELERRRLLAEASAPPEFPEDYDNGGEGSSSAAAAFATAPGPLFEPSAPVLLDDDDSYGMNYTYATVAGRSPAPMAWNHGHEHSSPRLAQHAEPLPKYER